MEATEPFYAARPLTCQGIVATLATSVCCETTAREAVARDFHVFFPSDGTATADMPGASAAELRKATLATLGFLFAQVLTVDEMMQKIKQAVHIPLGRSGCWLRSR